MKKRLAPTLAATILAANAIVGGVGLESAHAAGQCPNNNWSNKDGSRDNYFQYNGTNIRTGNSIDCTSLGLGYKNHILVLHCTRYNGSYLWWHLKDTTTGVSGWVRYDQLWVEHATPC